jgi:F-type H+-transporting ATPase subunit a
MISIIGLIPIYAFWGPNIVWKLFDMFIGLIQAFIFALLTVIYFGTAGATDDEHHDESHDQSSTDSSTGSSESEAPTAERELSGAH